MKKIFLLSLVVIAGLFAANSGVFAQTAALSVSPASSDVPVGTSINVSIQLNPNGNQVCVMKGTLVFENLSCQSITVPNTITAQTAPTCGNPNFTLGIPKCSSVFQNLMTVSVKSGSVGTGKINLSGVKVIGAGVDVPFNSQNGVYNIIAIAPEPSETRIIQQQEPEELVQEPATEEFEEEIVSAPESEDVSAAAGLAGLTALNLNWNNYFWIVLIAFTVFIVAYGAYYFVKKKKLK